MSPKLTTALVILALFLGGFLGGSIVKTQYLPIYEIPYLAVHSIHLAALDECFERNDRECMKIAIKNMILIEGERAKAALDFGLPPFHGEPNLEGDLRILVDLKEKHAPDA